jgi:hypothetical protein
MNKSSKFLLIAMSAAFAICILGLSVGMIYSLYESFVHHQELWPVLSRVVGFYRALGALGILGFVLFFAFLFSLLGTHHTNGTK